MAISTMTQPPLVAESERIFRHFNKHLFSDALHIPIISQASERRIGVKFYPDSYVMPIGASILGWTAEDFVQEFLHEMVHIYNHSRGILDCTSNQYHNQEFAQVAVQIGLYVAKHRTRGWAITSFRPIESEDGLREPSEEDRLRLKEVVRSLKFDDKLFGKIQKRLKEQRKATPSKTFLVKWICQCPPPHNCIRSGRRPDGPNPLKIRCEVCNSMFTADPED